MSPRIKKRLIAGTEAELLRRLRARGTISRAELARELELAPSTIGVYVDRLIDQGLLSESGKVDRHLGRPPKGLQLNPDGGRFVGVDIEARNILAVAVDFSQQPVRQVHKKMRAGDTADRVLARVEQAIVDATADDPRPVLGIGVGVPGTIDLRRGVATHYPHIAGWRDVPLAERLEARFGVPVYLEHNIRSMALAEMWFGQGRGVEHFVCLGVRSGIAAGIVVGGRLYHGNDGVAGKVGHWPVPAAWAHGAADGTPLEEVASLRSVARRLADALSEGAATSLANADTEPDWTDVVAAYRAGDALVSATLDGVADTLGWVVAQICLLLNPARVIVAGPLAGLSEPWIERLRQAVHRAPSADAAGLPGIVASRLGEHVGALGAAGLAVQSWVPEH